MTELQHGSLVYMETWVGLYDDSTATIGTISGHCAEYGRDVGEAMARAKQHGHQIVWALQTHGVCLYGDKREAERAANNRRADREKAICLTEGQNVLIEGKTYEVCVSPLNRKGPYNSDPIHFREVTP